MDTRGADISCTSVYIVFMCVSAINIAIVIMTKYAIEAVDEKGIPLLPSDLRAQLTAALGLFCLSFFGCCWFCLCCACKPCRIVLDSITCCDGKNFIEPDNHLIQRKYSVHECEEHATQAKKLTKNEIRRKMTQYDNSIAMQHFYAEHDEMSRPPPAHVVPPPSTSRRAYSIAGGYI